MTLLSPTSHALPGPSPIRVYYVTATSDRGGAESLLVELLSRIDRREFVCRVGSMVGGGWLTRACEEKGIGASTWAARNLAGKAMALWRELRDFRPDIVHLFGLRAEAIGRPLARWAGVRTIVSVAHSPDPWRRPLHVCLDRITARYVDQFVAVGRAVAASRVVREKFQRRRIAVIPNGVEPPGEQALAGRGWRRAALLIELGLVGNADSGRGLIGDAALGPAADVAPGPIVLMVGNLRPMKGHGEALEALARLAPEFPGLQLVVVGRDVSGGQYARRAEALGCADHVVWAGYREDPTPFYAAADVFLMPSYWEGCPTALLEAMAWRLPIVASRISGIAEIARPGREALLAPPRDAAALAQALARMLRNPAMASALADAAQARLLDRYTLDRMVARHQSLYRRLAGVPDANPLP